MPFKGTGLILISNSAAFCVASSPYQYLKSEQVDLRPLFMRTGHKMGLLFSRDGVGGGGGGGGGGSTCVHTNVTRVEKVDQGSRPQYIYI